MAPAKKPRRSGRPLRQVFARVARVLSTAMGKAERHGDGGDWTALNAMHTRAVRLSRGWPSARGM
jgi:hypothetical protein